MNKRKFKKTKCKFYQDSVMYYNLMIIITISIIPFIEVLFQTWKFRKFTILTISLFIILLSIIYLTLKRFSNKIIITYEGIKVLHFNKQINSNKWEDFQDLSIIIKFRSRYISFKIIDSKSDTLQEKCIEFNINNKRLSYLRMLCSNDDLKDTLDKIKLNNFFRYF